MKKLFYTFIRPLMLIDILKIKNLNIFKIYTKFKDYFILSFILYENFLCLLLRKSGMTFRIKKLLSVRCAQTLLI